MLKVMSTILLSIGLMVQLSGDVEYTDYITAEE